MNNIRKKNILNNFVQRSSLPYQDNVDVNIKTNQIVYAALNYALQKLLDNDLYIERDLLLRSNYVIGPKTDNVDMSSVIDNYKCFSGIDRKDNNLSIVQKIPYQLDQTLEAAFSESANFVFSNQIYYAGTVSGLMQSDDCLTWKKASYDELSSANVKSYCIDDDKVYFASNSGVFMLKNVTIDQLQQVLSKKLSDRSATAIGFDKSQMLIGTPDGLYYSDYYDEELHELHRDNTVNGCINAIGSLSGNTDHPILVGTENGLYGSKARNSFGNVTCISAASDTFTYAYSFSESTILVATKSNLYEYDSSTNEFTELKFEDRSITDVVSIVSRDGNAYVCAKGLYRIVDNGQLELEKVSGAFDDIICNDILLDRDIVVVATDNKLYWKKREENDAWKHFENFPEDAAISLCKKSGNIYCAGRYGVYQLEMHQGEIAYSQDEIELDSDIDITTTYFDEDGTILVGSTTGLYDSEFKLLQIYQSTKTVMGDTTVITDYVNKIRYQYTYDGDTYIICTNDGAYILNKNELGQYSLEDYHVLVGIDIKDVLYVNSTYIFVSNEGFYLFEVDVKSHFLAEYSKIKDIDNFQITYYDNNITQLIHLNNKIYALDGKKLDEFLIVSSICDDGVKYKQFKNDTDVKLIKNINTVGSFNSIDSNIAIKGNKILAYDAIPKDEAATTFTYKFRDPGEIANSRYIAALRALNDKNKKYADVVAMPTNLQTYNVLAARNSSNVIDIIDTANYTSEEGIVEKTLTFTNANKIRGLEYFYTTNSTDNLYRSKNIASIVATDSKIYVNRAKAKLNEQMYFPADSGQNIFKMICIPYLTKPTTELEYKRNNLYYVLTLEGELWYFNTAIEDDVDYGEFKKIDNTSIKIGGLQINDISLDDMKFCKVSNLERTTTKSTRLLLGTSSGLYIGDIDLDAAQGAMNFTQNASLGNKNIQLISRNGKKIAVVRKKTNKDASDTYQIWLAESNKIVADTEFTKFTGNDIPYINITAIAYIGNYIYILDQNDDKIVWQINVDDGKTKYISTNVESMASTDDRIVIVDATTHIPSYYDASKDKLIEIQYAGENELSVKKLFETYDQSIDKKIVCMIANSRLLTFYDDDSHVVDDLKNITSTTKADDEVSYYFVRDSEGNALSTELAVSELVFLTDDKDNSSYQYYYDITYDVAKYSAIQNDKVDDILNICRYEYDYTVENSNDDNEGETSISYNTLNCLHIATKHGLYYTVDLNNCLQYNYEDTDILLKNGYVVDVCQQDTTLFVLLRDNKKYILKICTLERFGTAFVMTNVVTKDTGYNSDNITIYHMKYVVLDEFKIGYLYFTTNSGTYYFDWQKFVTKTKTVEDELNCIYHAENTLYAGKYDGLYQTTSGDNFKLLKISLDSSPVVSILDHTSDTYVVYSTNSGMNEADVIDMLLQNIAQIYPDVIKYGVKFQFVKDMIHHIVKSDNKSYKVYTAQKSRFEVTNEYALLYSDKDIYKFFEYDDINILVSKKNKPVFIDTITNSVSEYDIGSLSEYDIDYYQMTRNVEFVFANGKLYSKKKGEDTFNIVNSDDITKIVCITENCYIDNATGIFAYDSVGSNRYFEKILPSCSVYVIYCIDGSNALIGTSRGLYAYSNGFVVQNKIINEGNVHSIVLAPIEDTPDGIQHLQYVVSVDDKIYKSALYNDKLNQFDFILSLAKKNATAINGIVMKNDKVYSFATNVGMLHTSDKFYLIDTYSHQNLAGIAKKIADQYEIQISKHIQEQHSEDNAVTIANSKKMDVDFSQLADNWQQSNSDGTLVENDIVDTVEFESDVSFIHADCQNYTNGYDSQTSSYSWKPIDGITYVVKNWKSKNKDIYVYLPTTNTYYANHVEGAPCCSRYQQTFARKNNDTVISGNVKDICTNIRLMLDNKHFDINDVHDIQINGNSLPLNIYVDDQKPDSDDSTLQYHSYILPSISRYVPLKNDIDNTMLKLSGDYVIFDFSCFGTDAQAIKISCKAKTYFYVTFNGNNTDSGMIDDMKVEVDKKVKLNKNNFIRNGYIFKGWSTYPNGIVEYTDQQEIINLSYVDGTTITLYAVWKYYVFDETSDTVLHLDSNKKTFAIAHGDMSENIANVVIDYGYVGDTTLTLLPNGEAFSIYSGTLIPSAQNVIIECED